VDWYEREKRDLPWRATRDPYCILVSEIMLQQTRAQTVIPYYRRFLKRFPDARSLAKAREADVLALWSGLGYYSRARNLQRAACVVADKGSFPQTYDAIRELAGVGPYTAAAVASIAFGAPHAVLDANVMRVIARLRGDGADLRSARTRARLQRIADELLDLCDPGTFNQAMMELGATVCAPKSPKCVVCPVAQFCEAHQTGRQNELPVKGRKRAAERIKREVALVIRNDHLLVRRRAAAESLMPGFWEVPEPGELPGWIRGKVVGSFRHTITHHYYTIQVVTGELAAAPRGLTWRSIRTLDRIPLTTISRKAVGLLRRIPAPKQVTVPVKSP